MPPTWTPRPRENSEHGFNVASNRDAAMRLVNIRPGRQMRFYLAALPFVLFAIAYLIGSSARLAENPNDKLLPALSSMAQAVNQMAFQADMRTGSYLMLADTLASLERLVSALAVSTTLALLFGIVIGLL